jgi:hypothetical protein
MAVAFSRLLEEGHMPKEWPLEGRFECGGGGRGITLTADCLGREFTSRTANHDFTIGLPRLDTRIQRVGRLRAPKWTYGLGPGVKDESEPLTWGVTNYKQALKLGSDAVLATLFYFRFYTSLTGSTDEELDAAAQDFVTELEDWRMHFASWVGILTSQDLVGLGGDTHPFTLPSIWTWTSNADGKRARCEEWEFDTHRNPQIEEKPLGLRDLQACVTATGNHGAPPTEWLFIRDARSLLSGGQNRRAVIDAATAAELAMTTLIDTYLATIDTDETVRTALMKRYSALEGRAALLRRLRSEVLSAQLQRDLIEPRNRATHGGHSLTAEQARTAVDMAIDIVEEAYPLASLWPTQ